METVQQVQSMPKRGPAEEGRLVQLVVFTTGVEEFCSDIGQVREILRKPPTITHIPDSPDFITGIINVRGEVVCVVDLKARFFLPPKKGVETKHIIISEQDKNLFGLMVDEVTEVLRISETGIRKTPGLITKIEEKYVTGVVTLDNRLIVQLDLSSVLSEEELVTLAKTTRHHAAPVEEAVKEAKAEKIVADVIAAKGKKK